MTVEAADALFDVTRAVLGDSELNYTKCYVKLTVDGNSYMCVGKLTHGKSKLAIRLHERLNGALRDEAIELLNAQNVPFRCNWKDLYLRMDSALIEQQPDLFRSLAALVKRRWAEAAQ